MTTFEKEYGQDFKITASQDDQLIRINHGENQVNIAYFPEGRIWDVTLWVQSKRQWADTIEATSVFEAFDLAKKALLACADENKAAAPSLSDRLETIREEAICAIEEVAEKGTIELLPEDIFDADSCWIKRITKIDHPAFKNSTSKLRDQLHVEVFSGDADENMLSYTSDLLTLRTDTLVQIAAYLAKN